MSIGSNVGAIGCGLMGSGIAEVCSRSNMNVVVVEADPRAAEVGRGRIEASLTRAEAKGKLAPGDTASTVMGRISIIADLEAMADRDVVIEAIIEDESAKTSLFTQLDSIVESEAAVLATNTSSIPNWRTGTGLKKWMPITCSGREVTTPNFMIWSNLYLPIDVGRDDESLQGMG